MIRFIMQLSLGPYIHETPNDEGRSDYSPAGVDIACLPEDIRQIWVTLAKNFPKLNQRAYFQIVQESGENALAFLTGLNILASATRPIASLTHASLLKRSGIHAESFARGLIAVSETFGQPPSETVSPEVYDALAESLIIAQEHARNLGEAYAAGYRCCHIDLVQAIGVSALSHILLQQPNHLGSFNSGLIYLHLSGLKVRQEQAQTLSTIASKAADLGLCWFHLSQINCGLINVPNFEFLVKNSDHLTVIDQVFQRIDLIPEFFTQHNFIAIVESGKYASHVASGLLKLREVPLSRQIYHCLAYAQEYASNMADIILLLHNNDILSKQDLNFLRLNNKHDLAALSASSFQLYYECHDKFTIQALITLCNAGEFVPVVCDALKALPAELITIPHCNIILAAKEYAPRVGFFIQLLNESFFLENLTPEEEEFFKNEAYRFLVNAREHATSFIVGLKALMVDRLIFKNPGFFNILLESKHKACEIGQLLAHLHLYAPSVFESDLAQFIKHPNPGKLALEIFTLWCEKDQPLNQQQIQELISHLSQSTDVPQTLILSDPAKNITPDIVEEYYSEEPSYNQTKKNNHNA